MIMLTTIDTNKTSADDQQLVGGYMLGEHHRQRGSNAHHVVDQQPAFPPKLVGYPAADKTADHAANGEYRYNNGVHEC